MRLSKLFSFFLKKKACERLAALSINRLCLQNKGCRGPASGRVSWIFGYHRPWPRFRRDASAHNRLGVRLRAWKQVTSTHLQNCNGIILFIYSLGLLWLLFIHVCIRRRLVCGCLLYFVVGWMHQRECDSVDSDLCGGKDQSPIHHPKAAGQAPPAKWGAGVWRGEKWQHTRQVIE